jgi:hypothetical protein
MIELPNDVWLEIIRHFFSDGWIVSMTEDAVILSSVSKRWKARLSPKRWPRTDIDCTGLGGTLHMAPPGLLLV